jgi:PadR family transcriptional regulator AphA
MSGLNRSQYAILKLLCKNPQGLSGYAIKQRFSNMAFCMNVGSNSQIYPVLKSLHGKRLVTRKQEASSGKRKRYIWKITDKGLKVFAEWLKIPPKLNVSSEELTLKLSVGAQQSKEQMISHIESFLEQVEEALTSVEIVSEDVHAHYKDPDVLFYIDLNIDLSRHVFEAKRQWALEALKRCQQ